jgi:exosortase D (VPLPA-CTERM-specific)
MTSVSLSKISGGTLSFRVVLLAACALLGIAAFGGSLLELAHRWSLQEEYSHGFLIPLISAWLLWARRDALRANFGEPSLWGVAVVALATALHVCGELSAVFLLSQVAFVVALAGLVLAIGGYSLLRVALLPIIYLLFAIPLPYFIDASLTLQLQLISSKLGVDFIRLFQIPVFLSGNIIDMGTYKLQVVEACSGLRYLYPLISLSFLAAYLFQAPIWQRAVIVLSSIPIAIGMNGLRIGVVGILVNHWGAQMAEGALHFFEGWVIFLACSALLAGEMIALAAMSGRRLIDTFGLPKYPAQSIHATDRARTNQTLLLVCLGLLCIAAFASLRGSRQSEIIPARERFVAFPTRLANWQGTTLSIDPATEQTLKVDDYILANYSRADGKAVNLYVAYYASQRTGESPHSPTVCLPGGGWLITRLERQSLSLDGDRIAFNRVIIQNGAARDLVYYWFDERGRSVADEYLAKWYLLEDSIVKNRSDGALIRLTTPIESGSEDDADRRLQAFVAAALPRLKQFLPTIAATPSRPVDSHPES